MSLRRRTAGSMIGASLSLALLAGGCGSDTQNTAATDKTTAATPDTTVSAPTSPAPGGASATGAEGAPMANMGMPGGGDPMAALSPTPELDKKIADAEKKGDKKAAAVAYTERGDFRQHDPKAGPRVMYRAALADFRKALKADPTNAKAKEFRDQIVKIYQEMKRPVPPEE